MKRIAFKLWLKLASSAKRQLGTLRCSLSKRALTWQPICAIFSKERRFFMENRFTLQFHEPQFKTWSSDNFFISTILPKETAYHWYMNFYVNTLGKQKMTTHLPLFYFTRHAFLQHPNFCAMCGICARSSTKTP